jgi:DNA helicase-2/ATP-dependent DNA helicase PcrA
MTQSTSKPSLSERASAAARASVAPPASAGTGGSEDYLEGLNTEQRRAVEALDGPVLVLAGAGTGKTRVLTTRLAHILGTGRAQPWQVLCVTFTNKAAREMRERASHLIGPAAEGLRWLGTFHSISAQMLRRHAELVDLKSSFTILDTDDQLRLIKQVLEAEGIDVKRWSPRYMASLIDGWKNRALGPDKLTQDDAFAFADGRGKAIYEIYQNRLKTLNACDFGDLLLHVITILQNNPDVLAEYHEKFRYLLVDEYQDTNIAQYLWLRLLARGYSNLCVVGDDDQSIYGWRGAEVDNILRFESDFPGAKVVRLERNYRSTGHILAAASGLITSNAARLGKTLWTEAGDGDPVKLRGIWDGEAEARLIADDIEAWRRSGRSYEDVALLVRASWQMRAFEERFIMLGIPYRVIGGPRFFERAEIRDAMAYFRLIRSTTDDLAFERVVNQPKRGVGNTSVQKLQLAARDQAIPLYDMAMLALQTDELRGAARTGLRTFTDLIERWRKQARELPHTELAEIILEESGYTDMLTADRSPQAQTRLDNLKELVRSMGEFDTLAAFLEHVELVMDVARSADEDEVQILTLHAAKGLEWPLVFLPGWEEEVFPSKRSLDETGQRGLEEERRLAYVGITRARERAYISFVANRQIYGRWQSVIPSRFIDELPEAHVDVISDTPYGAGSGFGSRFADQGGGGSRFSEASFGSTYESPGWKRAQAAKERGPVRAPTIEGTAHLVTHSDPNGARFRKGAYVFHDKFGYGVVFGTEGNKLTVNFKKAGLKKVIDSFVRNASDV